MKNSYWLIVFLVLSGCYYKSPPGVTEDKLLERIKKDSLYAFALIYSEMASKNWDSDHLPYAVKKRIDDVNISGILPESGSYTFACYLLSKKPWTEQEPTFTIRFQFSQNSYYWVYKSGDFERCAQSVFEDTFGKDGAIKYSVNGALPKSGFVFP
jgi:hypothetical protein